MLEARKQVARPMELAMNARRSMPSFFERSAASSPIRYSTCFCSGVWRRGISSSFETSWVGTGESTPLLRSRCHLRIHIDHSSEGFVDHRPAGNRLQVGLSNALTGPQSLREHFAEHPSDRAARDLDLKHRGQSGSDVVNGDLGVIASGSDIRPHENDWYVRVVIERGAVRCAASLVNPVGVRDDDDIACPGRIISAQDALADAILRNEPV